MELTLKYGMIDNEKNTEVNTCHFGILEKSKAEYGRQGGR